MTDQEAKRGKKRPKDVNQLAKHIVDMATDSVPSDASEEEQAGKDPAAVSLGRRGGLKGGRARAEALSPSERKAIATKAAKARWKG